MNFLLVFFIILPPMASKIIDLDHVCLLAALRLTEKEKEELAPQLEKIVEWVRQIAQVDLSPIEEAAYPAVDFPAPMRADVVQSSFGVEEALSNAPERDKEFFKVPQVIEGKE